MKRGTSSFHNGFQRWADHPQRKTTDQNAPKGRENGTDGLARWSSHTFDGSRDK